MTKINTKRALLMSGLALLLCVSMLVGSTYAWFTDSVTSGNNIIKSGNLDVELDYKKIVNGTVSEWADVQNSEELFDSTALWEPGHTEIVYLRVTNAGTLDLKYQLGVNVISEAGSINVYEEEFKLSDYLVFKVLTSETEFDYAAYDTREEVVAAAGTERGLKSYNGATTTLPAGTEGVDYLALAVYMPTDVDNRANYKAGAAVPTINLGVNLYATQVESESDSFGSDYDKNAWTDGFKVYNAADLNAALNNGEDEILLMADIALEKPIVIPENSSVALNLNGNAITAGADGYAIKNDDGGTLILDDTTGGSVTGIVNTYKSTTVINGGTYNSTEGASFLILNCSGDLTINDATINSCGTYPVFSYNEGHKLVINDATVNGTFGCIDAYGENGVVEINGGTYNMTGLTGTTSHIAYFSTNTTATINGGSFSKVGVVMPDSGGGVCASGGANLTINGGSFAGYNVDLYTYSSSSEIVVSGGTYKYDPTDFVADGYNVVQNADGTYTVINGVMVDTVDALIDAVADGDSVVLSSDIDLTEAASSFVLPADADVTLDLNGNTLIADPDKVGFTVKGNLTVTGGTMTLTPPADSVSGSGIITAATGGNVTLENVTVVMDGGLGHALTLNGGTMNLNEGCEIIVKTYDGIVNFNNNSVLNINGGVIKVEGAADAQVVGVGSYGNLVVNANSGKLIVNDGAAHYGMAPYFGTFTVNLGEDFVVEAEGSATAFEADVVVNN